eukprot:TRINITY_DN184_c2_g1_i3.p1 TRINITY_DN184_c2_g1~~TRINITY_DN184_c2_g1_i3.p1  ORF type:complete len:351 (-),score=80.57 TRINITY_DN184_c2_g1_i3:27-1079(-)
MRSWRLCSSNASSATLHSVGRSSGSGRPSCGMVVGIPPTVARFTFGMNDAFRTNIWRTIPLVGGCFGAPFHTTTIMAPPVPRTRTHTATIIHFSRQQPHHQQQQQRWKSYLLADRHTDDYATTPKARNDQITAPKVVLIDQDGKKLGTYLTDIALALARTQNCDLVSVARGATDEELQVAVPVCRITPRIQMNEQSSAMAAPPEPAPGGYRRVGIDGDKEVRFGYNIAEHDLSTKLRKLHSMLVEGKRVQVTVEFPRWRGLDIEYATAFLDLLFDRSTTDEKMSQHLNNNQKYISRQAFHSGGKYVHQAWEIERKSKTRLAREAKLAAATVAAATATATATTAASTKSDK